MKRVIRRKWGVADRWMTGSLKRAFFALLCGLLPAIAFGGCSREKDEKIVVTMLYPNAFPNLKALVESTYEDIDLQYEKAPYLSEQLRRLERGMGPDLLIFPQPSFEEIQTYTLDIGDTHASTAYDGTIMRQLQMEGNTYLLPLPGQYSGYIVNETLFEEAGLQMPASNQELIDALTTLKEQGLGVGGDGINFSIYSDNNVELGMYYVGYMVPDFLGTVDGVNWLADFGRKEAAFAGIWEKAFDMTDRLTREGLLDAASMAAQRNAIRHQERMADGTLAVVFGNSSLYRRCVEENKSNAQAGTAPEYSYRMLPLLSDQGNEPWLILAPSAYIGVNAAADETKQEVCKRILELLSTQEGQEAVVADLQMGVSYLKDYQTDTLLVPEGIKEYIRSGYTYNVRFPGQIVEYLGSQARRMLGGKMTAGEVLLAVDQYYYEGSEAVDYNLSVVGTVDRDLLLQHYNVRRRETEIGNLLADSIAETTGSPIAVANGGGIRGSLYQGEVYGEDLAAVCPFDNVIVILEMKGQVLLDMLENSLSALDTDPPGGRFLHVSGLSYTFDSSKPAGERLGEVKLSGGSPLDPAEIYQVAVNDYMAGSQGYAENNGDGYKMLNCYDDLTPRGGVKLIRETGMTYRDALAGYFENHKDSPLSVGLEGRITDLSLKQ